ncbi:heterokaryon incompatibility protein-domain-containing protein [Lasiosphaeris hirsuta]|uniref:Heterokaryon incompatibility protein-domain-containing protein n=1 Tax=Lasiosphaeris hirsuta TaxID=260670 RepID=A0AA40A9J9_9PEZI|nr:heterokaryon incompatibility protein-domain-containing protein [Lasiosphaeris hirsuta]
MDVPKVPPARRHDASRYVRFPHSGETWALLSEQWDPSLCNACHQLLSGVTEDRSHDPAAPVWPDSGIKRSTDDRWYVKVSVDDNFRGRQLGCKFCEVVFNVAISFELWKPWEFQVLDDPKSRARKFDVLEIEYLDPSTMLFRGPDQLYWDLPTWNTCRPPGWVMRTQKDCPDGNATQSSPSDIPSLIRSQMANCLSNPHHDGCAPLVQQAVGDERVGAWPARILRIADGVVILEAFDPLTIPGQYAALSYCWGDQSKLQKDHPKPHLANSTTLGRLYAGVPISELPLTLQHGVQVCQWLGIEYIWIDSLCILQDSPADWEAEAAKMEMVYSMAKVTIIAASSTSYESGFLPETSALSPPKSPSLPLPYRFAFHRESRSGFHSSDQHGGNMDPIDKRGWTFQEEVLASRYIRFTSGDIQWKCNAGTACFCGARTDKTFMDRYLVQQGCPEAGTPFIHRWAGIVGNFSQRHFSVETDKLLAISSLARRLAPDVRTCYASQDSGMYLSPLDKSPRDTNTNYFAGIWGGGALADISQLSWYCVTVMESYDDDNPSPSFSCPKNYVAPSFSWASVNPKYWSSRIRFQLCIESDPWHTSTSRVLTINTVPTLDINPFGRMLHGIMSVCGPILKCIMELPKKLLEWGYDQTVSLRHHFDFPHFIDFIVRIDSSLGPFTTQSGIRSVKRLPHVDVRLSEEVDVTMLMLQHDSRFVSYGRSSGAGVLKKWYHCLLLAPGDAPDTYQRTGFVTLYQRYTCDENFNDMSQEDQDRLQSQLSQWVGELPSEVVWIA